MKYIVGDIGNTLTKLTLLDHKFNIIKSYNIETRQLLKKDMLIIFISKILVKNISKKILFSSVVPNVFKNIKRYFNLKKYEVYEVGDLKIKKIIKIKVDNIKQVGSDRIANAIAVKKNIKSNCLVVDFGTATTFDIIKKNGTYVGGVIAPGVKSSIYNLNKSTALLPIIRLKSITKTYGKNTKDALNAGFLWGYQGLINNIIKKISLSSKTTYKVILTGGYSNFFKKYVFKKSLVDENITIKGLIIIYKEFLK